LRQLGPTYSKAILTKVMAVLAAHSLQKVAIGTLEDELSPRQESCLVRSHLDEPAAQLVEIDLEIALSNGVETAKTRPGGANAKTLELLQPEGLVSRLSLAVGHVESICRDCAQ
jgi:hypothetical protein